MSIVPLLFAAHVQCRSSLLKSASCSTPLTVHVVAVLYAIAEQGSHNKSDIVSTCIVLIPLLEAADIIKGEFVG